MEGLDLLFLNVTGGTNLSAPSAKRMRAHITKTNFAKRRQKLGQVSPVNNGRGNSVSLYQSSLSSDDIDELPIASDGSAKVLSPRLSQQEPTRYGKEFYELQECIFLKGRHLPDSPSEAAWFNLIATDPAAIEASMSVAIRNWSPTITWKTKAYRHSYKAVNLIKNRIASTGFQNDGVLATVITMAFGASLEGDVFAWNVHINGLANMIKERRLKSGNMPPRWLTDLIIQDSINAVFCFPRVYNDKITESLLEFTNPRLFKVRSITERVIYLRKFIDAHHQHHFNASFIAREIEEPLADLHHELRALRVIDDSYTRATSISIELALYLLWPSQSAAHLTLLAEELKTAISKFPIKGCSFMNLTSFQLVIGAICAENGSLTREWYTQCLASEVKAMQIRGWRDPLNLLQSRDKYAGILKDTFGALWDEVYLLASKE